MRRWIIFVAALVVAGCGIPEEQYNAKVQEAERLKKELDESKAAGARMDKRINQLRGENQALAKRLADLGENVQKLLGERSELASDLAATKEREARLQREQEAQRARLAKYREVINKFRSLITSGKLKIRIVRGRMVVEMASNILFSSGKAELTEEGKLALGELANVLRTIPDRDFQVAGHTDNVPIDNARFKNNWDLSTGRALTVVQYLQGAGVDPGRLSAAGYSEYQPSQTNDTEEGKAANRRIEIVLMPNLDELPDLSGVEDDISKKPAR